MNRESQPWPVPSGDLERGVAGREGTLERSRAETEGEGSTGGDMV